jgi:hypothetical protein
MLLAIDPGTTESGYVVYDGNSILESGVTDNNNLIQKVGIAEGISYLAIENITNYGSAVGRTTYQTCIWIGRFYQAWLSGRRNADTIMLVDRPAIKSYLCPKQRANDKTVIEALKTRYGDKGTKQDPGFTYGLKSHAWQAFALAVYCTDNLL